MDSDNYMNHFQSNSYSYPSKAFFTAQAARFSPQVDPLIRHSWLTHGGYILSPVDPASTPCFSFCSGEDDFWLSPLRKHGHVPLHAAFVLHSIAQGMCLDIGPFILDGSNLELQLTSRYEHKYPVFQVNQNGLDHPREGLSKNGLLSFVPPDNPPPYTTEGSSLCKPDDHGTIKEENEENIELGAGLAERKDDTRGIESIEGLYEDGEMDDIEQEDESIVQSIVFDFDEESYASTSYTSSFLSSGSVIEIFEKKQERPPLHIPIAALLKASDPCKEESCWKTAIFESGKMWEGQAFGVWTGAEA